VGRQVIHWSQASRILEARAKTTSAQDQRTSQESRKPRSK